MPDNKTPTSPSPSPNNNGSINLTIPKGLVILVLTAFAGGFGATGLGTLGPADAHECLTPKHLEAWEEKHNAAPHPVTKEMIEEAIDQAEKDRQRDLAALRAYLDLKFSHLEKQFSHLEQRQERPPQ